MRLNECAQVKETLQTHLGINLTIVDGSELFLGRLAGVTEPEAKRKIIGATFIDLFEIEALRIEKEAENTSRAGKVEWFLQGTLYADLIESLSFKGPSATASTSPCFTPSCFTSIEVMLTCVGSISGVNKFEKLLQPLEICHV